MRLIKTIFYYLFLLGLSAGLACVVLKPWWDHFRSRDWPTASVTQATLVVHTSTSARGTQKRYSCDFVIAINGHSQEVTQEVGDAASCKNARSAWVNPNDHADALIYRGADTFMFLILQTLGMNWFVLLLEILIDTSDEGRPANEATGGAGRTTGSSRSRKVKGLIKVSSGYALLSLTLGFIAFPQALMIIVVRVRDGVWPPPWSLLGFVPALSAYGLFVMRARRTSRPKATTPSS